MRRNIIGILAITAAGAALAGLGSAGAAASAPRAAAAPAAGRSRPAFAPGTELWLSGYNGPASRDDIPQAIAVSPDGKSLFVTGSTARSGGSNDFATVAYRTATGAQLWASVYHVTGVYNGAFSLAVSPSGKTVFVAGTTPAGVVTIAYDADTGAQQWTSSFDGAAAFVAVGAARTTVFVTGTDPERDYVTVAYDAATGAQLWARRYRGPDGGNTVASMAVSPAGKTVFVTGSSARTGSADDDATVAYDAATGAQLWARRYAGLGSADASAVASGPDGKNAFVAGITSRTGSKVGYYDIVSYNAATGAQLWARRYDRPENFSLYPFLQPASMAVSPAGQTVFIAGATNGAGTADDYATIAYRAATGAQLWARRYNGPANLNDAPSAVAVGPGGRQVYVTGSSFTVNTKNDYATVAYNGATGAQLWVRRYNDPTSRADDAYAVAVGPDGKQVFVTGSVGTGLTGLDYLTIAYQG